MTDCLYDYVEKCFSEDTKGEQFWKVVNLVHVRNSNKGIIVDYLENRIFVIKARFELI